MKPKYDSYRDIPEEKVLAYADKNSLNVETSENYREAAIELFNELTIKIVKKGDTIQIIGKRWFDKINGNTYFSAVGYVNNVEVVRIGFEYGYDNHFAYRIFEEMIKVGYCRDAEKYKNGGNEALFRYCERKGIKKLVNVSDVTRKKDL